MKKALGLTTAFIALMAVMFAIGFADVGLARAQEPDPPPEAPGHVQGTGTHFEVTDSEYLNVTLDSSESITLTLSSVPEVVHMTFESALGAASTQITLGGFAADTAYYKYEYEDEGLEAVTFTTDASGSYAFTQDLSQPHVVWIQAEPASYQIWDDSTGGQCSSHLGTWDWPSKTCTLTHDVYWGPIMIRSNGITLDGNGFQVVYGGYGVGSNRSGITVKNLNVANTTRGIYLYNASGNTLADNTISNAWIGIHLDYGSNDNTLTGNTVSNDSRRDSGIRLYYASGNTLTDNTLNGPSLYGIYLDYYSHNNVLTGNTLSNNRYAGLRTYCSNYNTVYNNNFINNYDPQIINSGYNIFNLAAPDGGNYYDTFDTPAEGCSDGDGDGFCDSPFNFPGGGDYLPWTTQDGWEQEQDTTPPEITPNVSGTLGENGWYTSDVTVSWTVTDPESEVSSTSGCDETVITADTAGDTLTCTATSDGGTASESVTIKRDATPPTASASASPGPNANGWNNTDVTVSFSGTDNLSGIATCDAAVVLTGDGAGQSASGTCTDQAGNVSAPATASGIKIDKTPPTPVHGGPFSVDEGSSVSLVGTASTDALSGVAGTAWDIDGDGYDDGDPAVFNGIDDSNNPVSLQVIDLAGNVAIADTQVTVNNVAPTIDGLTAPVDPVDINDQASVIVTVEFSDPGTLDTHDVTWDWGDDGSDTQYGATSPASQGHTYATPGVYPVTVTVTDDDGGSAAQTYEFIVIYDPDGGFVTGGGWIMSPVGACPVFCGGATGKANFGFVSKYKKGASVPTGNTEFQFRAGDLNFHSDSYDWLVVAGQDKAKYKGVGTINGGGNYGFMLTATDGSPDTFRIKIWDKDAEDIVVYDNKMGVDDDAYDGTALGGGNIKVHKAK